MVLIIVGLTLAFVALLAAYMFAERRARRLQAAVKRLRDSIPEERRKAVKQSRSVHTGLITQDFAPLLPDWPFELKDCRQVGAPLDYVVFRGMEAGEIEEIVFVEIKTGSSRTSARQRQIAGAVSGGRVRYLVYTPGLTPSPSPCTMGP